MFVAYYDGDMWEVDPDGRNPRQVQGLYHPAMDIRNAGIRSIYGDPMGNIWIVTNFNGIYMVSGSPSPFNYHHLRTILPGFAGGGAWPPASRATTYG